MKVESELAGGGDAVRRVGLAFAAGGRSLGVPKNSVTALTCFFALSHSRLS